MDFGASMLAFAIANMPLFPPAFDQSIASVVSELSALASTIQKLGPLVPFNEIGIVLLAFPALFGVWASVLLLRLALMVVGIVRLVK